jgi:anti-sigma factor RsiW
VSGCHTHGALLGGYVLGRLEPAEMEEVRRHLESCTQCAREAAKLSGLPALLDKIDPEDVPPPQLSPELEEVVLDRFVRERQQQPAPQLARRRRMPVLAAATGIAAALLLAVVVLLAGDGDDTVYATSDLSGPSQAAGPKGTAWLTAVDAGTHVSLQAKQLPTDGGHVYELWCVRPDRTWVSGGTFKARADGRAAAEFTAGVKPGDYHMIVITQIPAGAPEGARGSMVLKGHLKY